MNTAPEITPEIAKQLAKESAELRKIVREKIKKMHTITPEERAVVCRSRAMDRNEDTKP